MVVAVLCCSLSLKGRSLTAEGRNDYQDFGDIRAAMKVLFFSDQEILSIFKILAALLHIGNVKYQGTTIFPKSEIV